MKGVRNESDIEITEDIALAWSAQVGSEGVASTIELLCANQMSIEELREYVLENQRAEYNNKVEETK